MNYPGKKGIGRFVELFRKVESKVRWVDMDFKSILKVIPFLAGDKAVFQRSSVVTEVFRTYPGNWPSSPYHKLQVVHRFP